MMKISENLFKVENFIIFLARKFKIFKTLKKLLAKFHWQELFHFEINFRKLILLKVVPNFE